MSNRKVLTVLTALAMGLVFLTGQLSAQADLGGW